jgi:hypothetical protein
LHLGFPCPRRDWSPSCSAFLNCMFRFVNAATLLAYLLYL